MANAKMNNRNIKAAMLIGGNKEAERPFRFRKCTVKILK